MPPLNLPRQEEWKEEMNTALKESDDFSPFAGERKSFSEGFFQRQGKRNGCLKRQTKSSKWYEADPGFNRPKEQRYHLKNPNENVCVSGNDFLGGFSQRQEKNRTKPSTKLSGLDRAEDQRGRLEDSNHNEYFSGKDFLDGFRQKCKPETDPCGRFGRSFYERELLANSTDQMVKSPHTQCSKKYPVASTQPKPRYEGVEPTTQSLKSSRDASQRGINERGLKTSPDLENISQYTRKSTTSSIKTPSTSTRYISTNTSSTTSSNSLSSPRKVDEKEWFKGSTDEIDSPKYIREPLTASIRTPSPSTQYISTDTTSSRQTSYECPKVTEAEWKEVEKKSQNEQREFLGKFAGMFREEEVSSVTKNVRRGDHIFCHGMFGAAYNHHLLCTNVIRDDIYVIEYSTQFGFAAASYSVASSNPIFRALIATKEGKLTYEELEKKKAKVRKWPKGLERFTVDEVISRAESRINERDYHAFNNNCEHFVTWCKCGLNTSLQVKPWYQPVWDTVKGAGSATIQGIKTHGISKGAPALFKTIGNFSDELLGAISSPLSPVGFALGGVIETGYAASYIYDDWKRMKQGRLSKDQFGINSATTASQAAFHIAGGIAGSVLGSAAGPLGSAVGGAAGYAVGHAVGTAIGACYEYAPKIKKEIQDKIIMPVQDMVQSCVKAVKTVASNIWENVQSVFSSLFSWWI